MAASVDALDLPIQFFALETGIGMLMALIRYHRTGELDHWPVYVAYPALAMFVLGIVLAGARSIP